MPPRWVEVLRVVVALFVRWGISDTTEWKGDEALHYVRAAELARGERVDHLVGFQTSAGGAHLPATFHHLLALPCLLGAGPRGVAMAVSILYAAGLLVLLVAGARRLGRGTTFVAALLLAVAPGLVLRSRALRNEELLPPLVIVLLLLAIEARAERDPLRAARWAGFAAAWGVCITQVHLSAGFVVLPLLAWLVPVAWRGGLRPLRGGLVLLLFGTLPFLAHEIGGGFDELRAAFGGVAGAEVAGKPSAVHVFAPLAFPRRALGLFGLWEPLRDQVGLAGLEVVARAALPGSLALSQALGALASVIGLAVCLAGFRRPAAAGLLLAVFGPWALFVALGVDARVPYTLIATPALALIAARGVGVMATGSARARALVTALLIAPWIATDGALLRHLEREGAPEALYGVPYAPQREAIDLLLARGWRLEGYEAFEHVLLLDVAYRQLPPARQQAFRTVAAEVPYWELPYLIVFPADPAAPGVTLAHEPGVQAPRRGARVGPLVLRQTR